MERVSGTRLEAHLSGDGAAPGTGCAKYAQSSQNEGAGLRVLRLWSARPEHQHRACFLLSLSCRFSRGDLLPEELQGQPQPFRPDGPSVAIRAGAWFILLFVLRLPLRGIDFARKMQYYGY